MAWGEIGRLVIGLALASFFLAPLVGYGLACWRDRRRQAAAIRKRAEEDRCLRRLLGGRPE